MVKIVNLYSGADGESHLRDIEIPLEGEKGDLRSLPIKVADAFFREDIGGGEGRWHRAPRRQYIIMLEGELEIEVGDGTKRRLGPGEILLVEDTTGLGHISRSFNRKCLIVPLI